MAGIEWGSVLVYAVLILFALSILAKYMGQTLGEMIKDLTDYFRGETEEQAEKAQDIFST